MERNPIKKSCLLLIWITFALIELPSVKAFVMPRSFYFASLRKQTTCIPHNTPSSKQTPDNEIQKSLGKISAIRAAESENTVSSFFSFPRLVWRFTRPHTLIGSALAIPAIHALAAPSYAALFSSTSLISMFYTMACALLMNLYITGLNQITDVEIDKINKPYLPIAAGDLSIKHATWIVLIALALSLGMGALHPQLATPGLNLALWGSGILGTFYSLPPFRLKRFPLLAALCIVAVRGTVINAGFFAHAKYAVFGNPIRSVLYYLMNDAACKLSCIFFGIFGIVIALMKDVPDVAGDEKAKIRTMSVRMGQKRIFSAMKSLLTALFVIFGVSFIKGGLTATVRTTAFLRVIVGIFGLIGGISVEKKAFQVNPEDSKDVYQYYMHLWKLFYLSYIALVFAK